MQTWTMRILGILNIFFVALGAYYSVVMIHLHWSKWPGNPSRHEWTVFLFLYAISILMALYLAYLGLRLIKKDSKAALKMGLLCVAEIVYFFVFVDVTWLVMPYSMSKIAVGFYGMTLDPLAPQVVTGYPVIGLVIIMVLSLVRQKSKASPVA